MSSNDEKVEKIEENKDISDVSEQKMKLLNH